MGKDCGISYTSADWNVAWRSREVMHLHLQCHIQWCPPCPSMKRRHWSEFSGGATKMIGAGALALWTEAKGMGLIQHGQEVTSQGPDSCLLERAGRLLRRWCQAETIIVNWCKNVSDSNQEKTFPAWNSQVLEGLSREVVQSPSMDVFMAWLDKALSSVSAQNRALTGDLPRFHQIRMNLWFSTIFLIWYCTVYLFWSVLFW